MKNFSLHSLGKEEYIEMIKGQYNEDIRKIEINPDLSREEKSKLLNELKVKYLENIKNSSQSLF